MRTMTVLYLLLGFASSSAFGDPPAFQIQWGGYGSAPGQFRSPGDVALDPQANVYVIEGDGSRVQKFDPDGNYILSWGGWGDGQGQFTNPHALTCDQQGFVYVADTGNHRIQKFNSSGLFQFSIGARGTGTGLFEIPRGILVDGGGNIYVSDSGNDRIQKFNSGGAFLATWGSSGTGLGQLDGPYGTALAGNLFVVENLSHRIQEFTPTGTPVSTWGSLGSGTGEFSYPMQMDLGPDGLLYVVDADNNRMQVFTQAGVFVTAWGSLGSGPGQFDVPRGVAVDPSGRIYVADSANNRIQRFAPLTGGEPPNENQLQIGDAKGLPGTGLRIPVFLENTGGVHGLEVVITDLPDWIMVTNVELTGRTAGMTVAFSDAGTAHLLVYGEPGTYITAGSGRILDLVVSVSVTAVLGDSVDLTAPSALLSLQGSGADTVDVEAGTFFVMRVPGDVNGDNLVDTGDVVRLVEIILGTGEPPTSDELAAADCNEDGAVNVLDVTCVQELMFISSPLPGGPPVAALQPLSIVSTVPVKGFQFDLPAAGGSVEATSALAPFHLYREGRRVAAYDPSGASWTPGEVTALRIGLPAGTRIENFRAFGSGGRALAVSVSGTQVRIEPGQESPVRLLAGLPNPFQGSTEIRFATELPGRVSLTVFDIGGRVVSPAQERMLAAGEHRWTWAAVDGAGQPLPAGVYLARVAADGQQSVLRLTHLGR